MDLGFQHIHTVSNCSPAASCCRVPRRTAVLLAACQGLKCANGALQIGQTLFKTANPLCQRLIGGCTTGTLAGFLRLICWLSPARRCLRTCRCARGSSGDDQREGASREITGAPTLPHIPAFGNVIAFHRQI